MRVLMDPGHGWTRMACPYRASLHGTTKTLLYAPHREANRHALTHTDTHPAQPSTKGVSGVTPRP